MGKTVKLIASPRKKFSAGRCGRIDKARAPAGIPTIDAPVLGWLVDL